MEPVFFRVLALLVVLTGCAAHRADPDAQSDTGPDAAGTGGHGGSGGSGGTGGHAGSTGPGLHASGNLILDGGGHPLRLLGVNRAGSEYGCIQGWGIFDGPSDDDSLRAIR